MLDRLIQQAVLRVLQKRWDPTFSEHSYGFRPGRSAHQAVAQAQAYIAEGTPQGGPLSPLLSNLVLDDLDRELERRGHRFCRYADDRNIYVCSRRAGEPVMVSVCRFLTTKLRLKVNESNSAMARPDDRKFLGFRLTTGAEPRRLISPQAP